MENGVLRALALDLTSLHDLPQTVMSVAGDVVEANFSFNTIDAQTLGALAPFRKLEVLVLDNNELASLRELPSLPALKTLWVNNNAVDDLEETLNVLSRQCPQLEYLSLLRNPCCPNELIGKQETEYRRYRLYTKYRLPTLKNLDAGRFSDAEALEAREKGKFLRAVAQKSVPVVEGKFLQRLGGPSTQGLASTGNTPSRPPQPVAPAASRDEEDLFEKHNPSSASRLSLDGVGSSKSFSRMQPSPSALSGTLAEGNTMIAELDFGGRMNVLCDALLVETCGVVSSGPLVDGVTCTESGLAELAKSAEAARSTPSATSLRRSVCVSTPSSAAVFSEQKIMPSTGLCVGNRFITDEVL
jgi:hypothetical protein